MKKNTSTSSLIKVAKQGMWLGPGEGGMRTEETGPQHPRVAGRELKKYLPCPDISIVLDPGPGGWR